jgi:hypothetical protein
VLVEISSYDWGKRSRFYSREETAYDQAVQYLRGAEEADAEAIEGASCKAFGRRVGVSGEYGAGEAGAELLHGAHGAPEHALPAAAVIGVGVEEPRRGRSSGIAAAGEAAEG